METHSTHAAASPANGGESAEDGIARVIAPGGGVDPATDPNLDLEFVVRLYKAMVRTRIVDERATALQRQGRIGFHIGSLGEEAAVIGSVAALRAQDWVFPCYREWGAALWRGLSLQTYMDNLFGNADDVAQGRQMPDHITGRAVNFGSVTSPIGTQISQAVGFAYAAKYRGQDLVTAVYFGEGATSSNDFHCGMNFAGVLRAPALFLLRNNGWAISVPASKQTAAITFADKGRGYGVPALRCDGNDALAVYATVRAAVEHAAAGRGPMFVEMLTYRMGAHSTSDDPRAYRAQSEVEEQKKRDPIQRLRAYLEARGQWSEQQQQQHADEVAAEFKRCLGRAEAAGKPEPSSMFHGVYASQPPHLKEQELQCLGGPRAKTGH
ncbi:MAG: thiamine pyrophosphate-dependent enzyme [Proteobacteria bacterium]|nr:thiamine pyrophosphate-dependent enzyme [Pseudomonadota bacterium]